jgi:antitoxin VapB
MGLNIKNSETENAIRELAGLTGEKLTEAVHQAVAEKLERLKRGKAKQPLAEYLVTLGALQEALAAKKRGAP